MKLLLDENLAPRLAKTLSDLFPGSTHVDDCGLGTADDDKIWDFAAAGAFAILSKDSDFQERSALQGSPPKVIWLHIGNCATAEIEAVIRRFSTEITTFIAHPEDACLVITRQSATAA